MTSLFIVLVAHWNTLRKKLENIYKWCTYWKISIYPEKSAIADLSKRRLLSTPRISYAGSPLPWKDSLKYLGIIFSKTNQNGAIVKNLRAKALGKINALKTIAYKSYGPRKKDLVSITNNGICSPFYYSCAITNKLSQTHFKICDTIQTTALRVALGLPIWTPNIVLLKFAGQEILWKNQEIGHSIFFQTSGKWRSFSLISAIFEPLYPT
ncbi:hypothetical protein AVEN_242853-1 [Araneus ventricosus]|uniref:Reverse transcriptase domain-containing protein n=1 Tax=Araneus ventricosus TaxID=182803 RepID=A0A4Y2UPL4_ARAVE|nr:hypothetical protein AVEN_242853-1 [Araneus ventricosus]